MLKITQGTEGQLFYGGMYSKEFIANCHVDSCDGFDKESLIDFVDTLCKILHVNYISSGSLFWAHTSLPIERGQDCYTSERESDAPELKLWVDCLMLTCITTHGTIVLHASKELQDLFLNILFYDGINEGKVKQLIWQRFKGRTEFHSETRH